MTTTTLFATIEPIALPIISSLGLVMWGMELLQSGRPVLRVYVDTPPVTQSQQNDDPGRALDETTDVTLHGAMKECVHTQDSFSEILSESGQSVSINQCARISRLLSLALEVEDIFPSAYTLEVSSPGLSRPFFNLAQLQGYVGDTLDVVLTVPLTHAPPAYQGRKRFRGILQAVRMDEEFFCLSLDEAPLKTPPAKPTCVPLEAPGVINIIDIPWHTVRKAARVHIFTMPQKPGKKKP